jgi:hypothetical protein
MDQIQSEIQKKQIVLGEETDGGQKNTAEQITNSVYRAVKDAYKEELRGHGQEGDQDIE